MRRSIWLALGDLSDVGLVRHLLRVRAHGRSRARGTAPGGNREVTGERIRDKIAASKQKGMWMGGNVPLGYNASGRTLVINPAEAETVHRIFALYLQFACVLPVKEEADRFGLRTKQRSAMDGTERGGKPLSRGHIYRLLANPIYTGQIAYKGQLYLGQHAPLIDAETWTAVQNRLAAKARRHRSKVDVAEPSLLTGILTDGHGNRFTPSHAVRSGRRYRYYVSATPITPGTKSVSSCLSVGRC
jgi:hypothetical protein